MNFLKNILSSFIGSGIAFFFTGIILILIFLAMMTTSLTEMFSSRGGLDNDSQVEYGENSMLRLTLGSEIVEYKEATPFDNLDLPLDLSDNRMGLVQLLATIDKAATDNKVKGIFLNLSGIGAGYAQVKEIRDRLLAFKEESNKPIFAYSEMLSEKGYYLASVADEVYLTPEGLLEFNGLSMQVMYFKKLMEKLEIEPKIFRVGNFKSAVEPFLRDDMSDSNREQVRVFLESLYSQVINEIASSRDIPKGRLRVVSDSLLVRNVATAIDNRLIDGGLYMDEVITRMKEYLNLGDSKITFLGYSKYAAKIGKVETGDKIGVVIAEGDIISGKSSEDYIASADFIKNLRKARDDKDVKAIVLRINSPGGSALASDVMWREIKEATGEKPVIASMSSVAASGGYYMSMACDKIVAQPLTITGSIGVFGILVDIESFLDHKLGITTDRESTGVFSDIGSPTKEMTDMDSTIIQSEVNRIYKVFTEKAAAGRGIGVDSLKKMAGGRVWSGTDALEIGLVDQLGGLYDAIDLAAEIAEVSDYGVDYFKEDNSILSKLTDVNSSTALKEKVIKKQLGDQYEIYKALKRVNDQEGIQMSLPFDLIIE